MPLRDRERCGGRDAGAFPRHQERSGETADPRKRRYGYINDHADGTTNAPALDRKPDRADSRDRRAGMRRLCIYGRAEVPEQGSEVCGM